MTISSTDDPRAGPFNGNGAQTVFPFVFKTFAKADLLVVRTDEDGLEYVLVLDSDYSVSLNADQDANPGGSVTYPVSGAALPLGETLTIASNLDYTQTTDIQNAGGFFAQVVEDALDRNAMLVKQVNEKVDRALRVAVSTPDDVSVELPAPVANNFIGWNDSATGLRNVDPSTAATIVAFAAWQSQTFSGNGATTAFTLSSDPGNINNLDVSISGVTQTPGVDYVLSGTTLTFTTAPASGTNNVLARYGQALPQGITEASAVDFLQAGAGAAERSVQSKLRDVVSVKDFLAVGDGVADDTVAIQAALNSGAAAVYLPKGNYKITTALTNNGRVSMFGDSGFYSCIQAYNCDGITFNSPNSEGETYAFEDFSIEGMAGANYTAIYSPSTGGIKYGLHFSRLRLRNMNAGIRLDYNLHCSIDKCSFTQMNEPVRLGDTSTFTRVRDNIMVCMGGDTWGSTGTKRGVYLEGGSNSEALKVSGNFIYGFARGVQCDTVTDVNILDNGIDACTEYGILFTAVQHNFNIKDNFIELLGATAVAGICGLPLGSGEYLSQINIEGNSFTELGGLTVSTVGILMNTTADTYQWHVRIVGNVFNGMKTHDIRLNLPGETYVRNNRCMSTVPTQSIWIGAVQKAPVVVEDNWFKKAVYNDLAADLTNGKLRLRSNAVSDVFTASDLINQPWTPVDGSGAGLTLTVSQATYSKFNDRQWIVQCDVTWPVTADGSIARVAGMPATPSTSFSGAVSFSTVGSWSGALTSAIGPNFILYDATGVPRTNAAMSGKRVTVAIVFTS